MSLSAPFFGPKPMTVVKDENGVEFDAGPSTFGETSMGKPFFFVNNDKDNKYGHILSESEIEYPAAMLPAIKHDWMKRGYSESAIESYLNNFNNPALFVVEYNESTGAVELVVSREAVQKVSSLPLDLDLSDSLIARLAFGVASSAVGSEGFMDWANGTAVAKALLFAEFDGNLVVDAAETDQVIEFLLSDKPIYKSGIPRGIRAPGLSVTDGGKPSVWLAAIETILRRLAKGKYDISVSIAIPREELAASLGLEGFLPFENSAEYPAFTSSEVMQSIADYEVADGSLLVYSSLGLLKINGLENDPLAKVVKCIYPAEHTGNLMVPKQVILKRRGTPTSAVTLSITPKGSGVLFYKQYVESKVFEEALRENDLALDLPRSKYAIPQTGFDIAAKVVDALAVNFLTSEMSKFEDPEAEPTSGIPLVLNGYISGKASSGTNVTLTRAVGGSFIAEGTVIDHDAMIREIWPGEFPVSGFCYSALPSSKQERFLLTQARQFKHASGYKVLMCDVSMIRIRTTAKMIADLIEFKASIPGQTADEKAILDSARADLGTNVERDIFFTEYARPIKLVKDCVKTLAIYRKFKDAVDIYKEELISGSENESAVTFKAAQNRVNASLERRIFGHSFFEEFTPAVTTDYDVSKVFIKISNSPSSSDRLINGLTDSPSPFVASLCYKSTGNPVPFDSVLDASDILYWLFNGCSVEVVDPSIADADPVDYVFNIVFNKSYAATLREVGSARNEQSFDLDVTPFMDPLGFFDWSFVPVEQRGLVSLMLAGVPANDALALQLKRLFSINVGSAVIGSDFFAGMVNS